KRVFQSRRLSGKIVVSKKQVGRFAERGAGILEVRGRAHAKINAGSAAHHRLLIERIGKAQPRPNVVAVRRNRPIAGSGELGRAVQLLRRRKIQPGDTLHSRLLTHRPLRQGTGRKTRKVDAYARILREIAELELVVARGVGRTPLVAQAQIHRELRIYLPVVLDVKS